MRTLLALTLLAATGALAQEPPLPPNLEPVPDGPVVPGDEDFQPEVTIIRRDGGTIEEYRVNGRLYMVRVVPTKGLPYFLIDADGDGNMDTRRNDLDPDVLVPGWVIMSW